MASVQACLFSALTAERVVEGALLAVEELHHRHAGDVLLGEGVDFGGGRALAAVALAHLAAEDAGDEEDCGNDEEGEQGERPAHAHHDDDGEAEHEDVVEDGQDAGGEHLVEGVDIGGDAGDETADGILVVEGGGHALEVAEDLATHVEHDLLAGPLHEVGLEEFEEEGEKERGEVEAGDERDAADGRDGVVAEVARQPGELFGRLGRHVGVDGDGDEERAGDVAEGFDENGEEGQAGLQLVGLQVGEQTAHQARVVGFAGDIVGELAFGGLGRCFLRLRGFFVVCHPVVLF